MFRLSLRKLFNSKSVDVYNRPVVRLSDTSQQRQSQIMSFLARQSPLLYQQAQRLRQTVFHLVPYNRRVIFYTMAAVGSWIFLYHHVIHGMESDSYLVKQILALLAQHAEIAPYLGVDDEKIKEAYELQVASALFHENVQQQIERRRQEPLRELTLEEKVLEQRAYKEQKMRAKLIAFYLCGGLQLAKKWKGHVDQLKGTADIELMVKGSHNTPIHVQAKAHRESVFWVLDHIAIRYNENEPWTMLSLSQSHPFTKEAQIKAAQWETIPTL